VRGDGFSLGHPRESFSGGVWCSVGIGPDASRKDDGEDGKLIRRALKMNVATVFLCDVLCQRQAKAGSALLPGTDERKKHRLAHRLRYSFAIVCDVDPYGIDVLRKLQTYCSRRI